MRLPVTPSISTKDGISNKNARLTNALKETTSKGDMATIRPGLRKLTETTGTGQGVVSFNDTLLSVYGANLVTLPKNMMQWEIFEVVYTDPVGNPYLEAIATDGSGYVGIGFSVLDNLPCVFTSADFLSWEITRPTEFTTWVFMDNPYSIEYIGGTYVFVLYVSTDSGSTFNTCSIYSTDGGASWSTSVITSNVYSPGWDDLWVMGGKLYFSFNTSTYYRSDDGVTWTAATNIPTGTRRVVTIDNTIVASIQGGDLKFSRNNGTTWTTVSIPELDGEGILDITANSTMFYAVSEYTAIIFWSVDGENWTRMENQPPTSMYSYVGVYGLRANDTEMCFLINNNYGTYTYFLYNFGFREWYYVVDQFADSHLIGTEDGFVTPCPMEEWFGTAASNRFILTNTNAFRNPVPLSGSFFDFAQSTL